MYTKRKWQKRVAPVIDDDFLQLRLIRKKFQKNKEHEAYSQRKTHLRHINKRQCSPRLLKAEDDAVRIFTAIDNKDTKLIDDLMDKVRKTTNLHMIKHPTTGENIFHRILASGLTNMATKLITSESDELILSDYHVSFSGAQGLRNGLHIATEIGATAVAKLLLATRLKDKEKQMNMMKSLTAVDIQGQRPRLFSCLHLAAYRGHTALVRLYLDHDMPVDYENDKKDTALLWAARCGHDETITYLLARNADPTKENDKGSTALHWAVRYQYPKTVVLLLNMGNANPNTTRKDGLVAPLIVASAYGNYEIVEILLQHTKIDVNVKIRGGDTAIHYAAREGYKYVLELLIAYEAHIDDPNEAGDTPLLLAAKNGHVRIVKFLINHGANLKRRNHEKFDIWYFVMKSKGMNLLKEIVNGKNPTDFKELNLLCIAASAGRCDIVNFLLDANFDPESSDIDGNTFFHHAAMNDEYKVINEFNTRLSIDVQNLNGNTPLHIACLNGYSKTTESLLNCKAKVGVKNNKGETALHAAALSQNISVDTVEKLVNYVTTHEWESLNEQDNSGNNALHLAGQFLRPEVIWEFRSLRITNSNNDGLTPLHKAVRTGKSKALHVMLNIFVWKKRDGSLNEKSISTSETVLHLAADAGHKKCVRRLIDLGADISIKDSNGDTVLHRLVKTCALDNCNSSVCLTVFDTILNSIVQWWCLNRDCKIPDNLNDETALEYKRKAIAYITSEVQNNERLSVINLAFKLCVSEVIRRLLFMPEVSMYEAKMSTSDVTRISSRTNYMVHECCKSTRVTHVEQPRLEDQATNAEEATTPEAKEMTFDVTGLIPWTNNMARRYCVSSCVTHFKQACSEDQTTDAKEKMNVSGIEYLIYSQEKGRISEILDIPPMKMFENYYKCLVLGTFTTFLLFHIIYMSVFTYVSLQLLTALREDNSPFLKSSNSRTILLYAIVPIEPAIIVVYAIYTLVTYFITDDINTKSKLSTKHGLCFIVSVAGSYMLTIIYVIFAALVFAWIGLFTASYRLQDNVLAAALCIGWLLTISFTRGIQQVHYFYRMLLNIIFRDMFRFIVVYMCVLLAFGFALHALFQVSSDIAHLYSSPESTLFLTFNIMMGMATLFDETFETNMEAAGRTSLYLKVIYLIYIILATIILFNVLIAMMNDSYTKIVQQKQEQWRIESINLGLAIESSLPIIRKLSKIKLREGNDGSTFEATRWYLSMTKSKYLKFMQTMEENRQASSDAVSRHLDDIESKMTQMTKRVQNLSKHIKNVTFQGK